MTTFDDFPVGRVVETARLTITEAHLVSWAGLTGDWYPIHMDEIWAREQGPFGQRIAHGPLMFGLAVGMMERAGVFGDCLLAWLGADEMRAMAPTFIGDTVHTRAEVLEARPSKSDPGRGITTFLYQVVKHDGTVVLSWKSVLMMRRSA